MDTMSGRKYTMLQLEDFIDQWGGKPDEFFVSHANYRTGEYGLTKTPTSAIVRTARASELTRPEGETAERFHIGDLVRA